MLFILSHLIRISIIENVFDVFGLAADTLN